MRLVQQPKCFMFANIMVSTLSCKPTGTNQECPGQALRKARVHWAHSAPYLEQSAESLDSLGQDLLQTLVVEPFFAVRVRVQQSRLRKTVGQLWKESRSSRKNRVRSSRRRQEIFDALEASKLVSCSFVVGDSESAAELLKVVGHRSTAFGQLWRIPSIFSKFPFLEPQFAYQPSTKAAPALTMTNLGHETA